MSEASLAGIRVLDLSRVLAGPYCTMTLGDLGAEVIKVENPDGGDDTRTWGPPFVGGESAYFLGVNRNKLGITLNLKEPRGQDIFRALAGTADVVVENLRPGTMRDLELDFSDLRRLNPGLIYVAASGWGQDGPLRDRPGMDIMAQARSGLMSITGAPGGDPVKVGVPICDLVCALYGALAAVSALLARRESGEGQYIDVSLLESGVSLAVWEAGAYFAGGKVPGPLGTMHQTSAPYQAFRAADGWVTMGATTKFNWTALCRATGLERLLGDPRYADANLRFTNRSILAAEIEGALGANTVGHWISVLDAAGVPCAPIQDFGQVFNDQTLTARDFFWDAPHQTAGAVRQLGSPMRFSSTPTRRSKAGPRLGEDTRQVMSELGYDAGAVGALLERGVLAEPREG